ncbi:MAG: hypothetical protein HYV08_18410 [Deltaproteobacteria bacterium]|nr:hypothetical protein [Deltaproteobacteria bacterium]MBI3079175.1 hypothetical protein [Deltaproteobacteria bacterium]
MGMLEGFPVALMLSVGIVLTLLVFLFLVLWILLPFSLFGIRGLLHDLVAAQRETNEILRRLMERRREEEATF